MEIKNLLESSNQLKSMQADAGRLAEKWAASGLLEGLESKEANNMAMILENQTQHNPSIPRLNSPTQHKHKPTQHKHQ